MDLLTGIIMDPLPGIIFVDVVYDDYCITKLVTRSSLSITSSSLSVTVVLRSHSH